MNQNEQNLKNIMYGFNELTMSKLEELMEIEGKIHTHDEMEVSLLDFLHENDFVMYDGHEYMISEQTKEMFKKIYTAEFKEERLMKFQVFMCFNMAYDLYNIVPIDALTKIYNTIADKKLNAEQMLEQVRKNDDIKEDFAIVNNTIVDHDLLLDKQSYNYILSSQKGKGHYIPNKEEILFYFDTMELALDEHMDALIEFLFTKIAGDQEREMMFNVVVELRELIRTGARMQDVMDAFGEELFEIVGEDEEMKLFELLSNVWNNTRMVSNAGYTPMEAFKLDVKPSMMN